MIIILSHVMSIFILSCQSSTCHADEGSIYLGFNISPPSSALLFERQTMRDDKTKKSDEKELY